MRRVFTVTVPEVKPTRRTSRKPGAFGQGILAARPAYRLPVTAADIEWYDLELATAEDRHYDLMAEEAGAVDRHERGLCC
jgi:hypothetical protein